MRLDARGARGGMIVAIATLTASVGPSSSPLRPAFCGTSSITARDWSQAMIGYTRAGVVT